MKLLFLLVCLVSGPAVSATAPMSGTYECRIGNNDSICDQTIRVSSGLMKVVYGGYCGGQGPYTYRCSNDFCTDGIIKITYRDEKNYLWENRPHSISCEMKKVD